mgnify:CR=1 FL=1
MSDSYLPGYLLLEPAPFHTRDLLQPLALSPVETPGDKPAPVAVLLKELAAKARVPMEAADRTGG